MNGEIQNFELNEEHSFYDFRNSLYDTFQIRKDHKLMLLYETQIIKNQNQFSIIPSNAKLSMTLSTKRKVIIIGFDYFTSVVEYWRDSEETLESFLKEIEPNLFQYDIHGRENNNQQYINYLTALNESFGDLVDKYEYGLYIYPYLEVQIFIGF